MEELEQSFPFQRLIFRNEFVKLQQFIEYSKRTNKLSEVIDQVDLHGQTPLTMAISLGRKEMVSIKYLFFFYVK